MKKSKSKEFLTGQTIEKVTHSSNGVALFLTNGTTYFVCATPSEWDSYCLDLQFFNKGDKLPSYIRKK